MALIWFDGFDHYGLRSSTPQSVVLGAYVTVGGDGARRIIDTQFVQGHALELRRAGQNHQSILERPLDPLTKIGVGFHGRNGSVRDRLNTSILTLELDNGQNIFFDFTYARCGAYIAASAPQNNTRPGDLGAFDYEPEENAWHHFEYVTDCAAQTVSLRVDGVDRGTLSAPALSGRTIVKLKLGTIPESNDVYYYVDNLYVWDTSGTENNDWMGERNVYTLMPSSDSSPMDWVASTGSDRYAMIDNVPASAQYIEALNTGDVSVFGVQDTPDPDISVSAVMFAVRAQKTGTALTEISAGPVGGTPQAHPLVQDEYRYFTDILEEKPGGGQWEPSDINALQLEITRVT